MRTAQELMISINTDTVAFTGIVGNRPGLALDIIRTCRSTGFRLTDTSVRVVSTVDPARGKVEQAHLALSGEASQSELLLTIARLESLEGIMFHETEPDNVQIGVSRSSTLQVRLNAEFARYGTGCWLLIARGIRTPNDFAGRLTTPDAKALLKLGEDFGHALTPSNSITAMERMLIFIRAWNADIKRLDASVKDSGGQVWEVDAVMNLTRVSCAAAGKIRIAAMNHFIQILGGQLIEFSDLDLPDQNVS